MSRCLLAIPQVRILSQLWPFLRPERGRMARAMTVALLLPLVEVGTPLLIGTFVDSLLAGPTSEPGAAPRLSPRTIIALLAAGAIARGFLLAQQRSLAGRIGEQVARRIRDRLWRHLQRLPLAYTRQRGSGRLLVRFISDTRAVQRMVTNGLLRLSQELVLAAAILVALLVVNVRMALAVFIVLPIYFAIFLRLNPELRRQSKAKRRRQSRVAVYLQERISGMAVVKGYSMQQNEEVRFKGLSRQLARRGARLASIRGRLEGLSAAVVAGAGALMLVIAAEEAQAGQLTGGEFVAFYTLFGLLVPIFQRIVQANQYFQDAQISIETLNRTLAERLESPGERKLPPLEVSAGTIRVEDVSYRYDDLQDPPALCHISFEAKRGELVAIAGPNGSGKSTLLDLLMRFCQPETGRISIDGQDIAGVSVASLRSHIAAITQNAPLFNGTIAENIAYAVPGDVSDDRIQRAAQLAGVDQLVAELPQGWDTEVGLGGNELSGGQRQRVALARALALDPPILLFDEATSALDAESDQAIAETMNMLANQKTVIVITHRLPTLRLADRIYVLEAGRLVEDGVHADLLDRGGVYARLFAEVR